MRTELHATSSGSSAGGPAAGPAGEDTVAPDHRAAAETVGRIVDNVCLALAGKREQALLAVIGLLSGGHILLEDVPGVGKTLLARALARSVGADYRRVQFTPDLLPSDLTGMSVFGREEDRFRFVPGPVFANVVLADEINRAGPKTQSALLEAMAEGQATVDGVTRTLPEPFSVIATQNPAGEAGTHPLPHAELDRFMVKMTLGYPDADAEAGMLRLPRDPVRGLSPVVDPGDLLRLRRLAEGVHADEALLRRVVAVVSATRHHDGVLLGASPRAGRMLLAAARAHAIAAGRGRCYPEDVRAVAPHVLAHRIVTRHGGASGGATGEAVDEAGDIVRGIVSSLPEEEAA